MLKLDRAVVIAEIAVYLHLMALGVWAAYWWGSFAIQVVGRRPGVAAFAFAACVIFVATMVVPVARYMLKGAHLPIDSGIPRILCTLIVLVFFAYGLYHSWPDVFTVGIFGIGASTLASIIVWSILKRTSKRRES